MGGAEGHQGGDGLPARRRGCRPRWRCGSTKSTATPPSDVVRNEPVLEAGSEAPAGRARGGHRRACRLRQAEHERLPIGEARSRDRAWLVPRAVDVDHGDRAGAQRGRLDRPAGGASVPVQVRTSAARPPTPRSRPSTANDEVPVSTPPQRRPPVCWRGVAQGCAAWADLPSSRSTY